MGWVGLGWVVFAKIRDATFSPKPITGTALQRHIPNNYRLTTAHYRQITGTYMAFNIKDVYRYRRFADKVGIFATDYGGNEKLPACRQRGNEILHL